MKTWRWAEQETVRSRIAAEQLRGQCADSRLGDIVLRDHQRDAADRLRLAIDRFGGALLADDVGLGKTYTALAVARGFESLLIVAPAALVPMWKSSLERSSLAADLISFETLSRREIACPAYHLVIVDEAHHARNPVTHRYEQLAAVTRAASVLLLTATPVHNAGADLDAVLALFLGSRAEHLTPAERSACIVRRTRDDIRDVAIPQRSAPVWCDVKGSPETLQAVLSVPPPCPLRDGGVAAALVATSLVRSWSSTEAALRSALRRRIARAEALADALVSGRYPSRAELRAWVVGDDATQLAFPELITDVVPANARELLHGVRRHADGARRALAAVVGGEGTIDYHRAAIIREIRSRHHGERIVIFSQYAESVREMFSRLREDGGVAAVTANGATVAGGPLTRAQVLDRFAPMASSARAPSRAEAVELLLATDLLSEGLNLQDASVVVHLDLPWTAARLTQRLGRVWRIGSTHAQVHEYAIAPPAPAEQMLRVTELLARKAGAACSAIGETFAPLLARRSPVAPAPVLDRARAGEELRKTLRGWTTQAPESPSVARGREPDVDDAPRTAVAAVRAAFDGWLAAVTVDGESQLIAACAGSPPTGDPRAVFTVARSAEGDACVASPSRVERVLAEIGNHLEAARAAADVGISVVGSRARAVAASRIALLTASAPPHRRVAVSRLAASARGSVARSRSAGAERLLAALVSGRKPHDASEGAAEAWLERVAEASEERSPNAAPIPDRAVPDCVTALIVLVAAKAPHSAPTPENQSSR